MWDRGVSETQRSGQVPGQGFQKTAGQVQLRWDSRAGSRTGPRDPGLKKVKGIRTEFFFMEEVTIGTTYFFLVYQYYCDLVVFE